MPRPNLLSTPMRSLALPFLVALAGCGDGAPASAQAPGDTIRYRISFEGRARHEARIAVTFPALDDAPLEVRMSRTSPGRYALHEFAKNVYGVEIEGADGRGVAISRPDLHQWTVADHGGEVTFRYTLFADRADGTYAQVDRTGALLNAPASLVWARSLKDRPSSVAFDLPDDWRVATQLFPTGDPAVFTAPSRDYLLDSPMLIGDVDVREWTAQAGGTTGTIRFALRHLGTDAAFDAYADRVRAVVDEMAAVYGELPAFDGGTYTFLGAYLPWASGDGMEHRNSTVLSSQGRLPDNATGLLGTVAHEFFHAWNVERIRPASLEPFDFEAANVSRELWFAEGFTSYYDDLVLVRSGQIDQAEFARRMGGLAEAVVNGPGRRFFSPTEMSMQAPFVDAAVSVDPQNRANTFISYYTWGAALGLALDLEIRSRFAGRSLDDVMRAMWARHGAPFQPYTVDDVEAALAETVGDAAFAQDFFARFVHGETRDPIVEAPDFAGLLARGGIRVRPSRPGAAILARAPLRFESGGAVVESRVLIGSPLYEAGISACERIISVDRSPPSSAPALDRVLRRHAPGDVVDLVVEGRGGRRTARATLVEDPTLEAVTFEEVGEAVPGDVQAFRRAWLGSRRGG